MNTAPPANPMKPTFGELVGALAFLPSVYVLAYIAVFGEGDFRSIALGGLTGVVGASLGFYLRAKLQGPNTPDGSQPPPPNVTITDSGPTNVDTTPTTPAKPVSPTPGTLRGATHIPSGTGTIPPDPRP